MASKVLKGKQRERIRQTSLVPTTINTNRRSTRLDIKRRNSLTRPSPPPNHSTDLKLQDAININEVFPSSGDSSSNSSRSSSPIPIDISPQPATPRASKTKQSNSQNTSPASTSNASIRSLAPPLYPSDHILGSGLLPERFDLRTTNYNQPPSADQHQQTTSHPKCNTEQPATSHTQIQTIIEPSTSFNLWIRFQDLPEGPLPTKYQKIREIFTPIKGFHNVIAPRRYTNLLKAIFTTQTSRNIGQEKATHHNIASSQQDPQPDNQMDRTIIVKEIPLGTTKAEIQANLE